jgi:hypothetical protein
MPRACYIPLLAAFVLGALGLEAQLPSNLSSGGLGPVGGVIGRGPARQTSGGRVESRTHHRRGRPIGGFVDPFWYPGYYSEPVVIEREVPVQPVPAPPAQIAAPEPQRIPTAPKVTDIPATAKAETSRRMPAAVFVLASGERIESRHYLLTAESVQLTVERKRRRIALEALDLRATLAANRERGLDLQIPIGGSEVVLGF